MTERIDWEEELEDIDEVWLDDACEALIRKNGVIDILERLKLQHKTEIESLKEKSKAEALVFLKLCGKSASKFCINGKCSDCYDNWKAEQNKSEKE